MGVEQVYEDAFTRAREYEENRKKDPINTRKDLQMETMLEILNKKRFITCHSYVQSEINMLMKVADKHKFKINTFTHILEGYKVADKMKAHGVNASTFSDWWAYKMEVVDAIPHNAAILTKVGVNTCINSDDAEMARRLNQEAAKTVKYGNLTEEEAWKTITLNPAKALHLDNKMGSIKVGKDADVVLWSENPLSIYAKAEKTYIDGVLYFDREKDVQLQNEVRTERNRLIQKMIDAKKGGESTEKPKFKKYEMVHCEDFEDIWQVQNAELEK
jgi:urease alpha subunit